MHMDIEAAQFLKDEFYKRIPVLVYLLGVHETGFSCMSSLTT